MTRYTSFVSAVSPVATPYSMMLSTSGAVGVITSARFTGSIAQGPAEVSPGSTTGQPYCVGIQYVPQGTPALDLVANANDLAILVSQWLRWDTSYAWAPNTDSGDVFISIPIDLSWHGQWPVGIAIDMYATIATPLVTGTTVLEAMFEINVV